MLAQTASAVSAQSPVSMIGLMLSELRARTALELSERTRSARRHTAAISPSMTIHSTLAPLAFHLAAWAESSDSLALAAGAPHVPAAQQSSAAGGALALALLGGAAQQPAAPELHLSALPQRPAWQQLLPQQPRTSHPTPQQPVCAHARAHRLAVRQRWWQPSSPTHTTTSPTTTAATAAASWPWPWPCSSSWCSAWPCACASAWPWPCLSSACSPWSCPQPSPQPPPPPPLVSSWPWPWPWPCASALASASAPPCFSRFSLSTRATSLSEPTCTVKPSTMPTTPSPSSSSNSLATGSSTSRDCAKSRKAAAIGCEERASTAEARRTTRAVSASPLATLICISRKWPSVMVPVLSRATVRSWARSSIWRVLLTRMPHRAREETPHA